MNERELFEDADRLENMKDDVLDELAECFSMPEIRPGDFTYQNVMDKFGLSRNQAQARIRKLLNEGKIIDLGFVGNTKYFRKVN